MQNLKSSFCSVLFCASLLFPSCRGQTKNKPLLSPRSVKRSELAGSWYPGDAKTLRKTLEDFFGDAKVQSFAGKNVVALISPHAGYAYSGKCAAYAYKALKGKDVNRVVILAPTHYEGFRGFSTPRYSHYETPLGLVEIDQPAVKALSKDSLHVKSSRAHGPEHSLEIQLPFLQYALGDFKVVPVLIGELSENDYDHLAGVFKKFLAPKTVFVVSSDFTHYGARFGYLPFNFKKGPSMSKVKSALQKLDYGAIDRVRAINFGEFRKYVEKTNITVCGRKPIALLLKILGRKKDIRVDLLRYYTSIDIVGDYSGSVSYASIVFSRDSKDSIGKDAGSKAKKTQPVKKGGNDMRDDGKREYMLSSEEKRTLLSMARDTLERYLKDNKYPSKNNYKLTRALEEKRGVFVTLHKKGNLRGCIGYIEGIKPVYQAVMENTVNAALQDPRFPPVKTKEIKDIDVEISVMTPLVPVKDVSEIEVGKHGLVISRGWNRGLLLPQVATEWNWDRQTFLEAVSNKAGLPKDVWKEKDAKLERFSAIVFGEKSL